MTALSMRWKIIWECSVLHNWNSQVYVKSAFWLVRKHVCIACFCNDSSVWLRLIWLAWAIIMNLRKGAILSYQIDACACCRTTKIISTKA